MRSGPRIRHGLVAVALVISGLLPSAGRLQVQAATLSVGNLFVVANPEGTISRAQISFTGVCLGTVVTFAWDGGTPARASSCGNNAGVATARTSIIFHDAGPHTAAANVGGQVRTATFTIADAAIVLSAVGHNLRIVLDWLRMLLRLILIALRRLLAVQSAIKSAS